MTQVLSSDILGSGFTQVAFVVKEITAAERFFLETIGVRRFWKMENLRVKT